jgi:PAS domain S-box-containing protein
VQRRGSLFPEDDLKLLDQLARAAGTALDHAYLITEQRERVRRNSERRLREVELRMSMMLDSIKDYALFVVDEQGRVAVWHVGGEVVFGHTAREMTDEPAGPLYGMSDEEFAALLADASRLGHAEHEGPCRRGDGARFIGATTIRPLAGDEDAPRGFVVVTRDITERLELEERLRQGQKMEAIGRLAGGVAHDFNNLLTAIMGHTDLLAMTLARDDPRRADLSAVLKNADRAANLVRQLLSFSRRQVLQPTAINLSRLVADLLPMLRRLIGEQIEIVDQTATHVSMVMGDRNQLEQVVVNLSVNARDAMPGGGRLTIRTSNVWIDAASAGAELAPGPYVMLEVSDTGVGMDAATKQRIFEPFFTTKEMGSGTGLGLSTVFGIVTQMGGAVFVESERHQGATFRLYFPEARADAAQPPEPVPAAAAAGGSETILLVEDDEGVRTFAEKALTRHGYRVLVAASPAAALDLVQSRADPIDLLIVDVVLPGRSGPELATELGRLRPGVPVLFISGYFDGVVAAHGLVAKPSHFLQKPFMADDLLLRVRQLLPKK